MPRQVVRRRKKTVMQRYALFLTHHPFLILTVTFFANIVLLLVIVCTGSLPAFDDPQAGFEPRGTLINQRAIAWRNFLERDADETSPEQQDNSHDNNNAMVHGVDPGRIEGDYDTIKQRQTASLEVESHSTRQTTSQGAVTEPEGFFCQDPVPEFARIIFRRKDSGDLMNLESVREICSIDQAIRSLPEFRRIVEKFPSGRACRSYTLSNYITVLSNKSSCHQLTESDIQTVQNLTRLCLPSFLRGHLVDSCRDQPCSYVPTECVKDSLIYHLLYFLSDKESRETRFQRATSTLLLLPVGSSDRPEDAAIPLYRAIRRLNVLIEGRVQVFGMEMGLGDRLFDVVLLEDTLWMGIAAVVVVALLWLYTASFLVTLMNMLAIFFSLEVSYFVYLFVLRLTFFPFMNLLACVIIVAVGADALVIYARIWHLAKTEKNDGKFEKIVHATFRHAAQAMLVSSLTASAALFADLLNPIISIRCFSIFAGLTVIVHFFFCITWMPASFILADKWSSSFYICRFLSPGLGDAKSPAFRLLISPTCRSFQIGLRHFCDYFRIFFEKIFPCLVIRLKWLWVGVFCLLTVGSCCLIFVFPGLQLADSRTFALWNHAHPHEQYRLLKVGFVFEDRMGRDDSANIVLRIVWGVLASQQADYLDPQEVGQVVMDEGFDLSAESSQKWMLDLCSNLRDQDFYDNSTLIDVMSRVCFMEAFKTWMDSLDCSTDSSKCCENSTFPYPPSIFVQCSQIFVRTISQQTQLTLTKSFGPNFNSLNQIDAFVLHFPSTEPFSHSYARMQAFHSRVEKWLNAALTTAPPGLRHAWLSGDFDFLDLQQSLVSGTVMALILSLVVALIVLFLTTLNVGVSVISILIIAGIMLSTVATLILMDWQLNVFESTIIGLAIGLSADFTLHYAVSYCCAEAYDERELKTNVVIAEMASSVTMSALTTFLAGAFMIPSEILFYHQIGLFITVVIGISLFYATVLFPALLAAFGPQGSFLQFHYPSCLCYPFCCRQDPSKLVEISMHSSTEFDTTITTGTMDRDHRGEKHHIQTNQPYQHTSILTSQSKLAGPLVVVSATPEPPVKHLISADPLFKEEETDSLGELSSISASRGPSIIRRQTRGMFPWDYIMQKLPLTRHFSVAGSSVIYIDADVRSVTSDMNGDIPAVLPNIREDVPEVWVRRID